MNSKNAQVTEIDVSYDTEQLVKMKVLSECTSVPQIFIFGWHIGGNSDLQQLEKVGQLDPIACRKGSNVTGKEGTCNSSSRACASSSSIPGMRNA